MIMKYDVLVIATGANYSSPWREKYDTLMSYASREAEIVSISNEIKRNKSILIVGGGPTGTETASHIADFYKNDKEKVIGLGVRGNELLANIPGIHA
jgi:NADH dehydrogenase FAD-containing subunit